MRLISAGSLVRAQSGPPRSPDSHALIGWDEHFVARFNFEGTVPGVGVPARTDHSKLTRRMRIADHLFAHIIVTHLSAPGLSPAEQHPLLARETIEHKRSLSLK